MPKVSVVMPVYNGEAYLSEAIDSIIAQTFSDWEFIIVNEFGSNEKATAILDDYAFRDSRIHIIQNSERLGIAESLNVGLRAARGEYIARMDGDDICGCYRLEKQLAFLERNPNIDICGIEVSMFGDNTWEWNAYCGSEYLRCACLFYTPFVHPTIMMRTASLRYFQLEYNRKFTYTEDYDFFVRASEVLNFENIKDKNLYYYRYTTNNATNVGGQKGVEFQWEVMAQTFTKYGLNFSKEEIAILSPNTSQRLRTIEQTLRHLEMLDLLLKKVLLHEKLQEVFGVTHLFQVLHRRWIDAYEQVRWNDEIMEDGQVQRAIDRGLFCYEKFWCPAETSIINKIPKVSIVLPTYNSEDYIMDTIYSLLNQDYPDFELIVVNEFGSDDRTVECISLFQDKRIRVIQNKTRLGLAKSLNCGMREARGQYIARADADDVYPVDRLRKQVEFMDHHPEIAICGSWQRHFGQRNYIHTPPTSSEEMKASLLFKCEVCHSTVMLRKESFVKNNLWYDDKFLSEDYELWCRASRKLKFATIPEVLGEYRWNGENITVQKMDRLEEEAQKLVARNLKDHLGMHIAKEDLILVSGWKNPFFENSPDYIQLRKREAELLDAIYKKNSQIHAFEPTALKKVLDQRRGWAFITGESQQIANIMYDTIKTRGIKGRVKNVLKKFLKPLYAPFRHRYEDRLIALEDSVWKQEGILTQLYGKVDDLDGHLYDYYSFLKSCINEQGTYEKQIEERIQNYFNSRLDLTEKFVNQIVEEKICQVEKTTLRSIDALTNEMVIRSKNISEEIVYKSEQMLTLINKSKMLHIEQLIAQTMDNRMAQMGQQINQMADEKIQKVEQLVNQSIDEKVQKAEQIIDQMIDERIQKAVETINQTTDGRIWKAEQLINQVTDTRVWKSELLLNRSFQTKLRINELMQVMRDNEKPKLLLIGTPEHLNIGDAAIALGELEFFKKYFPGYRVIELSSYEFENEYENFAAMVSDDDLIFLQGGGNLGNRYLNEEKIRRRVIKDFPNNQIVILPQTIYFDEDENGKKELDISRKIYAEHPNLMILTRGLQSLNSAKSNFPTAKSMCFLDMALILRYKEEAERKGILLCLRDLGDESGLTDNEYRNIQDTIATIDPGFELTNNYYQNPIDNNIYIGIRRRVVLEELKRFALHQVIVTDRLHGLIFAIITKTPCVLLSSYNQKIPEFYDLVKDSNAIFFVEHDAQKICEAVEKALEVKNVEYPFLSEQKFSEVYDEIMKNR